MRRMLVLLCVLGLCPVVHAHHVVNNIDVADAQGNLGLTVFNGLNDAGAIVGSFPDASVSYVLTNPTAPRPEIRTVACPGSDGTAATAINRYGETTGFCGHDGKLVGFFLGRAGVYIFLDVPGSLLTEASGLNNRRWVVGDYRDAAGVFHGFFWANGQFTTLDVPFPDATSTGATAINYVGTIVGLYFDNQVSADFPNGHVYGWIRRASDRKYARLQVPGAITTLPVALNDFEQVVGIYADAVGAPHSFLWHEGIFYEVALPIPNIPFVEVVDINNRFQFATNLRMINADPRYQPYFLRGAITQWEPERATILGTTQAGQSVARAAQAADQETTTLRLNLDGCLGDAPAAGLVTPLVVQQRHIHCRR